MSVSPIEAEATGQEFITADYGGHGWRIPLDVDSWPVDRLLSCVVVNEKLAAVNHFAVAGVMRDLLSDQWPAMAQRKRRDLVPASHAFAAAVGIPRQDGRALDVVFGGIPRLLHWLAAYEGPCEATLRAAGLDYRDRFRIVDGRRQLTLRQISNELSYAPYDCPLNIARNGGKRPLSDAALAIMDVFEAITRRRHPMRPMSAKEIADRAEQQQQIEKQTADAKALASKHTSRQKTALDTMRDNAREAQYNERVAHARQTQNAQAAGI